MGPPCMPRVTVTGSQASTAGAAGSHGLPTHRPVDSGQLAEGHTASEWPSGPGHWAPDSLPVTPSLPCPHGPSRERRSRDAGRGDSRRRPPPEWLRIRARVRRASLPILGARERASAGRETDREGTGTLGRRPAPAGPLEVGRGVGGAGVQSRALPEGAGRWAVRFPPGPEPPSCPWLLRVGIRPFAPRVPAQAARRVRPGGPREVPSLHRLGGSRAVGGGPVGARPAEPSRSRPRAARTQVSAGPEPRQQGAQPCGRPPARPTNREGGGRPPAMPSRLRGPGWARSHAHSALPRSPRHRVVHAHALRPGSGRKYPATVYPVTCALCAWDLRVLFSRTLPGRGPTLGRRCL